MSDSPIDSPDKIAQALHDIHATHGHLDPELLVAEAADPHHVLHDLLTWEEDDA